MKMNPVHSHIDQQSIITERLMPFQLASVWLIDCMPAQLIREGFHNKNLPVFVMIECTLSAE